MNTASPMAVREHLHMAVQMGNMQSADTQQMTHQPEHQNAQPMLPAVSILEVVHQAPRSMELLTPEGVKALTATCTQLRQDFRQCVTTIRVKNEQDQAMLFADKWPNLVMVVISTTVGTEQWLFGNLFTPYLLEREWVTMVRIEVEESPGDPRIRRSSFKQIVALVVTARHQSSRNMDTKYVALAHLATEWVAKTQSMSMFLTPESEYMSPVKHLHVGDWPRLESIMCLGQHGNVLHVSCFWGEHSSSLQGVNLFLSSLDEGIIQSLVITCPHLHQLELAACKIEAAALACFSQASFSTLCNLCVSNTPLGWSDVRSLSSCNLPALQRLTLVNTNLSALAAMHLAQGCWPNLMSLHLLGNQLNVEAVTHLIKGEWPLLQMLGLTWPCVPEAAFAILGVSEAAFAMLGVAHVCKQLTDKESRNTRVSLPRSSFLIWPKLKTLTVQDAIG